MHNSDIPASLSSATSFYLRSIELKGNGKLELVHELLNTGVCPRCCLRFCGIGGKQSSAVYCHPPPDPKMLQAAVLDLLQGINSREKGSIAPSCGDSDSTEVATSVGRDQGCVDKLNKRLSFSMANATEQVDTGSLEGISVCQNSRSNGRRESTRAHHTEESVGISESITGCDDADRAVKSICPLCTGVLQHLDSTEDLPRSDPNISWPSLTKTEKDPDWRVAPSAECKCLKAILESSEHLYSEYGLDVFVPENVALRDVSMFRHLQAKFPRLCEQNNFETNICPATGVKAAAKLAIAGALTPLAGPSFSETATFRLCVKFAHEEAAAEVEQFMRPFPEGKRLHQGKRRRPQERKKQSSDELAAEAVRRALSLNPRRIQELTAVPPVPPRVSVTVHVKMVQTEQVYVAGRYIKLDRNISQTEFIVDGKRKGTTSVQEIIEGVVLQPLQADSLTFISSGREDMDVRMLGEGRPFVLELKNPRTHRISRSMLESIAGRFERSMGVIVKNLKVVDRSHVMVMKDGEKDKKKMYAAVVWLSRSVQQSDFEILDSIHDMNISQDTPLRVAHRRAALSRSKILHSARCERVPDKTHWFVLWIVASAGTYIKEFIHGDMGRTHPSVSSLLGCDAVCEQLDVTGVIMTDDFNDVNTGLEC